MNSEELIKILLKYKKKDNEIITHTVIPDIKNKRFGMAISVPSEDIKKLYDKLHDFYFIKNGNLSLTESFGKYSPLIIDIDLKYENKENKRYYTSDYNKEQIPLFNLYHSNCSLKRTCLFFIKL